MGNVIQIEVMVSAKRPGKEQYSSDGAEVRTIATFDEGEIPITIPLGEDGTVVMKDVMKEISYPGLVELHRVLKLVREKV